MPPSKSKIVRLKKIDELFKCTFDRSTLPPNSYMFSNNNIDGYWTREELAEVISDILELEKIITTRTIKDDITDMEIVFGAPLDEKTLKITNKKGQSVNNKVFFYWDKNFGVFNNNNLQEEDLKDLRGAIEVFKQFKGFKEFEGIDILVDKLGLKISKIESPEIFFDTVDEFTGINRIDEIADAVKSKHVIQIKYQAFGSVNYEIRTIHPYQLREYNNRWFVLAYTEEANEERKLGVYGLDRIINKTKKKYTNKFIYPQKKQVNNYFKDIIGVTNYLEKQVEEIVLEVTSGRAKYISTKPWHLSQSELISRNDKYIFSINVKQNQELEALILSFGKDIKVKAPQSLVDSIAKKLREASAQY